MRAKWIIGIGILVVMGGIGLFVEQLVRPPVDTSAGKKEVIAEIIRNWQDAHPADRRFVILPTYNMEAVLDEETSTPRLRKSE